LLSKSDLAQDMNLDFAFQAAAEMASDGMLIVEKTGHEFCIVYANEKVLACTRHDREELLGAPVDAVFAVLGLQDRSLVQVLDADAPHTLNVAIRLGPGERLAGQMEIRPLPVHDGEPRQTFILIRDVQDFSSGPAISNLEGRYQILFESQSRPMWIYDEETFRFVDVNRAAVHTYGYSREEFLNMSVFDIRPEGEVVRFREYAKTRHNTGNYIPQCWQHRKKDGSLFQVEVHSSVVHVDGRCMRLVETTDVSERHALEEQLRQAQKMEAIGQLAGGISHDFNNLLTVINGYSSMLCDQLEDDHPMRADLVAIRRSGERAAGLTRQLLAFSRKQVLQPALLDLNELVLEMESMLKRIIREDISLVTDLQPGLHLTFADPTQMEQVIMNLVINARDAVKSHGTITIKTANVGLDHAFAKTHLDASPGEYVTLAVRDTGCGIEPAALTHIFEPFYTTKEKGRGTGLGLPTVYGVVKQSDGQIEVESTVGGGTIFTIYLKATAAERRAPVAPPGRVTREKAKGVVLLVEDDAEVRQFITMALKQFGYHVLVASEGQDAVNVASGFAGTIDLLITDVVMPKMNGYDVARQLVLGRPGLRVLFLSGYSEDTYSGQPLDITAKLLPKPFTPADLGSKVREMLSA
jgi:two-component system cell cycle sensor histidine kinase/response regulator CckA